MHEMQTIVTDVRGVCLSICPSVCLSVFHGGSTSSASLCGGIRCKLLWPLVSVICTGLSWEEKFRDVRADITTKRIDALVITVLEEIAC